MAEAEVIVVAASRDQADVLRRQADQLVKRSGERVVRPNGQQSPFEYRIGDTVFEVKSGLREIRCGEARMRVQAADAATGDGVIPTLALVDELHRHRTLDLYQVLRKGLTAPSPKGRRGSLKGFEKFCSLLKLDTGEQMHIEEHERKMLRPYFAGVREIVVIIGGKNGKTTLLAALALYHLKTGTTLRQMITISTAGLDEESPLGQLRTRAHKLPSFRRRACLNTAAAGKSFAWLEWCLAPEDDRTDFVRVKQANPASWHTLESLRSEYESPSQTEGSWARLRCGVWTAGEESWLEAPEWDALRVDIGGVTPGEQVCAAVVYGTNPAIAIAAARPEDQMALEDGDETVVVLGAAVSVRIYEGKPRYTQLEKELVAIARTFDLVEVAYDDGEFGRSAELLEARGLSMLEVPHSTERMARATSTLQRVIHAGILRHDGDEALRGQALHSVIKETNRTRWLEKSNASRGVVAMAIAVHQATQLRPAPSKPMILVGRSR